MEDNVLFMIGNAHIDPVWLWRWQEGFQEIKATFRSALDRMKEDEDFVFVASSAAFYAWIEQTDPAMFVEIRQSVADGRWGLVGGWWVEPDCNIPGGEAFVRQGLYGQRYFESRFGRVARVGYCPDSFGHNATLPQILKRSGLDFYIFMRPGPHENPDLPHLFWWEASDGSRVLTYRIPYAYGTSGAQLEAHIRRCSELLAADPLASMCFFGVGNHGGGPTRENLELIHALGEDASLPMLTMALPEPVFVILSEQRIKLSVVHNELQHHASGCYAAHSGVKRWNRQAEQALLAAEKWSTLASWLTRLPYPANDFERAWKDVLFNQFHDILAGTSIEAAYDDARMLYDEARAIAARATNAAVQSLAWQVRIQPEPETLPVVVFNPHGWTSRVPVEVALGASGDDSHTVVDETGATVPVQPVRPEPAVPNIAQISFIAELPPLGYRTYRVKKAGEAATGSKEPDAASKSHFVTIGQAGEVVLHNAWFRMEFDVANGGVRLFDKRVEADVFAAPAAQAVVLDDPSDTWSHGVFCFDCEVGAFAVERVRLLEHGPVKSVVRVTGTYGASWLTQDFTLYAALPQIDVQVTVDWHESFKMLRLKFPLNLVSPTATYEIPYGHIVRPPDGKEEPGQAWVDVSGVLRGTETAYGLSLLNDGKYSFSVNGTVLRMTVLRSPIYAHHVPFTPDPEGLYTFMDQGMQHFRYALLPHTGTWKQAQPIQRAAEFNQPPEVLKETFHPWGRLPQRAAFITVEPDNIVVSALKRAEDGEAWILRCYETHNVATPATIQLPYWDRTIQAVFWPGEIKTFLIPGDRVSLVLETDLLEREI
ncbi:MAG: glycoside hydrolase family 38 C-terminal domain-containing protein [Anaerolineae bacterium]